MGSHTSKTERIHRSVNSNPWYPSLKPAVTPHVSAHLDEPLLQGSSLHINLCPTALSISASVDLHLANTLLDSSEKLYVHFYTIQVQQDTIMTLRYTKSGKMFYTLNGVETAVKPKGLNFHRPVYILLELRNIKYNAWSTLDVGLVYIEKVEKYEGSPEKADVYPRPDRFGFRSTYEIMELLLNDDTLKAVIDEPLVPGTKFYLSAVSLNIQSSCFLHVYLTNTSLQEINEGEVTLVPFDMTYRLSSESKTVVKLRYTWDGVLTADRDGQGCRDKSGLLQRFIDNEIPNIYIVLEMCNMVVDVTRMEEGGNDDEYVYRDVSRSSRFGGVASQPPNLRNVQGQAPQVERAPRPRIRVIQNEDLNRLQVVRRPARNQNNV